MAARRRPKQEGPSVAPNKASADASGNGGGISKKLSKKDKQKKELDEKVSTARKSQELQESHLPPLPLVLTVLVCSGALWVLALRDVLATGRPIAGQMDEGMLHFTKSTDFYDDSQGWKSTGGGLSAIQSITTDENNMGGFFVRKVAGAAALTFYTQKLAPLLFHPVRAQWTAGHFTPLLTTSVVGNLAVATFYQYYMPDLKAAEVDSMGNSIYAILVFEALVMFLYLISASRRKASASSRVSIQPMPEGKTPRSVTSRIVTRTVAIVSGSVSIIAVRDLFFPGQIISAIPRDDIYLEWTGAFIHSPPSDSPEAEEHSMEAPLFIGDKFVSQLMALYMLISCLQKFATAFFIRYGKDGSGEIKCRMIWKVQAFGDGLIVFLFRLFAAAATTASLDLRWHLMALGYETFIIGLYGFF